MSEANRPQNLTSLSLLGQAIHFEDSLAWERFVAIYSGYIAHWLQNHQLQPQDVEDICQDVMSVVIRELPNFHHNGNPGAFRNWIRTIAANRLRQQRGRLARRKETTDFGAVVEDLSDANSEVSQIWNREHDAYVLEKLLAVVAKRVQPKTFEAFRRVVLEQEPISKVASALGMKLGAVRVAQSRVLRALREEGSGLVDPEQV